MTRQYGPMTDTDPRIAPLPFDQWGPDAQDILGKALLVDGEPLNIFGTLAHHPKLLRRWLVFATHVLSKSTLPPRDREILILRIGWLCRSSYEWSQHVAIGKGCGLTDDDIEAIRVGASHPHWSTFDAALVQAADDLHHHARISDGVWATLSEAYSTEQLLDVVFAVGNYTLVSMALNTCGVQLDASVPMVPL
jgi:4-carboxymuconolactone decarboxylase